MTRLTKVPAVFHLKPLQAQLGALKSSKVDDRRGRGRFLLARDVGAPNSHPLRLYSALWVQSQSLILVTGNLLLEIHIMDLAIHELGFSAARDVFIGQANQRLEWLYGCLQAIRCSIDKFLRIPPSEYVDFSARISAMMSRCPIEPWRLAMCEYFEWGHDLVQDNLDIAPLVTAVGDRTMAIFRYHGLGMRLMNVS